jgi:hypothetical protein
MQMFYDRGGAARRGFAPRTASRGELPPALRGVGLDAQEKRSQ